MRDGTGRRETLACSVPVEGVASLNDEYHNDTPALALDRQVPTRQTSRAVAILTRVSLRLSFLGQACGMDAATWSCGRHHATHGGGGGANMLGNHTRRLTRASGSRAVGSVEVGGVAGHRLPHTVMQGGGGDHPVGRADRLADALRARPRCGLPVPS